MGLGLGSGSGLGLSLGLGSGLGLPRFERWARSSCLLRSDSITKLCFLSLWVLCFLRNPLKNHSGLVLETAPPVKPCVSYPVGESGNKKKEKTHLPQILAFSR